GPPRMTATTGAGALAHGPGMGNGAAREKMEDLSTSTNAPAPPASAPTPNVPPAAHVTTNEGPLSLEAMERNHIIAVLRQTNGVVEGPNGAARLLNLKPSTARFRMKKLGIRKIEYL
ncbi:MAG TPA: helix-turn-helix domain-containing protein, partial [Pseudonocardiaceae bacterium]|nr:helix-turn-helix domain-containing protein [Pseudonocardiaceae bacterium]